jgi:hypothetical protein
VATACATGVLAAWRGRLGWIGQAHALSAIVVGVPFALHLWIGARRAAASAVLSLLALATAGALLAPRLLPPRPLDATVPPFAYATRDARLYEPAESCGECHVGEMADWRRSTHARTLELGNVQESLAHSPQHLQESLTHVGRLIADRAQHLTPELLFGACDACHAPAAFYGDDPTSLLRPSGRVAEGVGCAFCHTLREVRDRGRTALPGQALSSADVAELASRAPFFVSAPETVRRYLGQGSTSRLGRFVSYWLIRFRPEVHSRDYHAPLLDGSRACMACHSLGIDSLDVPHLTYVGWERSPFNTGDARGATCQDCHMVQRMTGRAVSERGRQVPWGPLRDGVRSHLLLGGNVTAARALEDDDLAAREHELNTQAVKLEATRVERSGDALAVTVSVATPLVGHHFPSLETQLRYGWVAVRALDAAGRTLAVTAPPRDSSDYGSPSPLIMGAIDDPKPDNRRLIAPGTSRELVAKLALPPGAAVARVVAELHDFVDPSPIATAIWRHPGSSASSVGR